MSWYFIRPKYVDWSVEWSEYTSQLRSMAMQVSTLFVVGYLGILIIFITYTFKFLSSIIIWLSFNDLNTFLLMFLLLGKTRRHQLVIPCSNCKRGHNLPCCEDEWWNYKIFENWNSWIWRRIPFYCGIPPWINWWSYQVLICIYKLV